MDWEAAHQPDAVTPTVIQFDGTECGPATLAMILAYYGRPVRLDELSDFCQVEQDGSRASHLLAAARHYGLSARGLRLTAAATRTLPTPFIAHWRADHFVVVEAFTPGRVTINDPASGRRVLTAEEFDQAFSGVVLAFSPAIANETPASFSAARHDGSRVLPQAVPAASDPILAALRAGIRGAVGWLPRQVGRYRDDFSRVQQQTPRLVVKAICEQDICHTLRVAGEAGLPVVTRGAGHARHGQSLTAGGILLVNFLDTPIAQYRMVDAGWVEVTARSHWVAIESELNRLGRSIPTLPAYGSLSVGGTLSVGGYGERSIVYGSQLGHVRRLRLVIPSGYALWCSPQEEPELFRHALAGLGQVGVIERVVLDTIPYRPLGEPIVHHYPLPAAFLDGLADLVARTRGQVPNLVAYAVKDRGFFTESCYPAGRPPPCAPGAHIATARPDFRGQNVAGEGFRLAADYLFDLAGLAAYLNFLQGLWRETSLGAYADWALILAVRNVPAEVVFPLEARPTSSPAVSFLVGFYPTIPPGDSRGLTAVREILRRTLTKCLELGGRPYLYGSHELDETTWLAFYGDGYRRLKALRRELDPRGLLNGHIL
jgi:FAD/FMN-containing dehydrogenase/predicted double-glycine peptidase